VPSGDQPKKTSQDSRERDLRPRLLREEHHKSYEEQQQQKYELVELLFEKIVDRRSSCRCCLRKFTAL
jgi:hypothetical protein